MVSAIIISHEIFHRSKQLASAICLYKTMSANSTKAISPILVLTGNNPNTPNSITTINAAQVPHKLIARNCPSRRSLFRSLLIGLDLHKYIDGSHPCPSSKINNNAISESNPAYIAWNRQDQLISHAILASIPETVIPYITSSTTSEDAKLKLVRLYTNRSHSRALHLHNSSSHIKKDNLMISEYM